jgi:YbbR domain-containing protein
MGIILKILRIFTKRAFIGALFFALALWGYTSMNTNYSTYIEVPLTISLPEHRAIEQEFQPTISIEAKGTGWNLFNLLYVNKSKKVHVDLTKAQITDSIFVLSRTDFIKGLESFEKVVFGEVLPENITLKTGKVIEKKVPVVSMIKVNPREGFYLVGDIRLRPDSIRIRGNEKVISQIQSWSTKELTIDNANKRIRGAVELSDSLGEVVQFGSPTIDFEAEIQLTLEKTFYDIPIVVRGGSMPRTSKIFPETVDLVVRGGIDVISKLNRDRLAVTLDYTVLANDKNGILIPQVESPSDIEIIRIEPAFIHHKVFLRQRYLAAIN